MKFSHVVSGVYKKLKPIYQAFIKTLGTIALIGIVLSFTDLPYTVYYWLGTHNCELEKRPDYIVLLGGVGMPSPEDLMRTYFAAGAALQEMQSKVIIAFPPDTSNFPDSPEILMAEELMMRGIDTTRILFERNGYSTYSQAQAICGFFDKAATDTLALRIITSPEHMYRAVQTFRKAGFGYVGGTPAFENAMRERQLQKDKKKKNEKYAMDLRYNMWSYLKYEITVLREFCAIGYYKVRGWM